MLDIIVQKVKEIFWFSSSPIDGDDEDEIVVPSRFQLGTIINVKPDPSLGNRAADLKEGIGVVINYDDTYVGFLTFTITDNVPCYVGKSHRRIEDVVNNTIPIHIDHEKYFIYCIEEILNNDNPLVLSYAKFVEYTIDKRRTEIENLNENNWILKVKYKDGVVFDMYQGVTRKYGQERFDALTSAIKTGVPYEQKLRGTRFFQKTDDILEVYLLQR